MQAHLPVPAQVAAIIPHYGPAGDGTRILAVTGAVCDVPLRPRAVLARLARARYTDLAALRRGMQTTLGRRVLPPLPLAPGLVLVALKLRRPRVAGDLAHGWVNGLAVQQVATLDRPPFRARLTLAGGWRLDCCWSTATVRRHLRLAALAETAKTAVLPPAADGATPYAADLGTVAQQLRAALAAVEKLKTGPPQ